MKNAKKLLASWLVIIIIASSLPMLVSANKVVYSGICGAEGDNVIWEFIPETGTLIIDGSGAMADWSSSYTPWSSIKNDVKSVVLGAGITNIGNYTFYDFSNLASIEMPETLTSIGEYAFVGCISFTNIIIPNSVTNIGVGAFMSCNNLKSIVIPDGVTSIGYNTFSFCDSLESIAIPNNVITIGEEAFWGCSSLTSITIPKNVEFIGMRAFCECRSLENIWVDSENLKFTSNKDGVLLNQDGTMLIQYPIGNKRTDYTVPSGVNKIGYAAFWECSNLISITISYGVERIGMSAFGRCRNLTSVTIPNSVTSIETSAFHSCISITKLTIPDSVISIGTEALYGCTSLKDIIVDVNNPEYTSDNDGVMFNKSKTMLIQYPIGNKRTSYSIPNSVTQIGYGSFGQCANLTSITIPNSVTSIENEAFENCTNLKSLTIPNGVKIIEEGTFNSCTSLTDISIPESLNKVEWSAFHDCESLKDVYYAGGEEEWRKIEIEELNEALLNAAIHFGREHTHKYIKAVTEPTCVADGYTTYTCSCGNTYTADETEATGHNHTATTTSPTCTEGGYTTYTCACGESYIAGETDATGHSYGDDNICDNCGERKECSCNCHKTGIAKFFFDIILFFQKLFGQNKVCVCGAKH